jgi:hypothetical protein
MEIAHTDTRTLTNNAAVQRLFFGASALKVLVGDQEHEGPAVVYRDEQNCLVVEFPAPKPPKAVVRDKPVKAKVTDKRVNKGV